MTRPRACANVTGPVGESVCLYLLDRYDPKDETFDTTQMGMRHSAGRKALKEENHR